ncbi:protein of unknown function (plasmid) [Caballeronia sp. S22]
MPIAEIHVLLKQESMRHVSKQRMTKRFHLGAHSAMTRDVREAGESNTKWKFHSFHISRRSP